MGNRVQVRTLKGDFPLGNNIETTNDTVPEALPLTIDEGGDTVGDWVYAASAENNGGGGVMDDEPGIIYQGPAGTTGHFRVAVTNAAVVYAVEGIADPDAEDTVSMDCYVNGTVVITSDEGQTAAANEAATIVFNITAESVPLVAGDVLRFALTPVAANETSIDWDLLEGGEWSVS